MLETMIGPQCGRRHRVASHVHVGECRYRGMHTMNVRRCIKITTTDGSVVVPKPWIFFMFALGTIAALAWSPAQAQLEGDFKSGTKYGGGAVGIRQKRMAGPA